MSSRASLKGITKAQLVELIRENAVDGKWVKYGIEFDLEKNGEQVNLAYGNVGAFLISHHKDMSNWYFHKSFELSDALAVTNDLKYLADVFGVNLDTGTTVEARDDTPEFDQRDITIAKLDAQIEVYKDMLPSTDKVTYQKGTN